MHCNMGPSTAGVLDSILLSEVPTGPSGQTRGVNGCGKTKIEQQVGDKK
jgi:hypothetical protein